MKNRALSTLPVLLLTAALGFGTIVAGTTSQAAAPFQQKQVAGFHRTTVGAFEVTSLLDAPDIGVVFDGDGATADKSRAALFAEAART